MLSVMWCIKDEKLFFFPFKPHCTYIVFNFSPLVTGNDCGTWNRNIKLFANAGYTEKGFSSTGEYEKLIYKLSQTWAD